MKGVLQDAAAGYEGPVADGLSRYSFRIKIFVVIDFFHNFDHSSYLKNMQVSFTTLFATYFIIVGILNMTILLHICNNFFNKTNGPN
jgi:hypothetical protein